MRSRLEALLRTEFSLPDAAITDATDLADELLIDSLAKVELAMVVEDELSIGLGDAALSEVRTFGDLCAAVTGRVGRRGLR
ncbi:MAG: phosphopantetheine-binding protein [Actinomycetota bacterium]|nr:phosphopantetheine-binding protein [Actinomycetota bacterium]